MQLRAFLSGAVIDSSAHPISRVWRFGRGCRHLINGGKEDLLHGVYTVMILQRTRVSPRPRTKKGKKVLHGGSQVHAYV